MVHHFKTTQQKKEEKKPEINSFQDPKPIKVKTMSFQMDTSYMDARSMLFDETNTHHTPPSSPSLSPQQLYSPRSPSYSPPASIPSRESSVWALLRGLFTYRQEETSVWTSLHTDPMTLTEDSHPDFQLYCRKCHPSTIQTGEISQSKSQTGFQHYVLNSFQDPLEENWKLVQIDSFQDPMFIPQKCSTQPLCVDSFQDPCDSSSNWLISRPYVCIQHKTVQIDSFQDPCIGLHSVFILHGRHPSNWQC